MDKLYTLCFFLIFSLSVRAQQNNTLYLWHDVQESNLLNPAIPVSCKWYVGIPVLSSLHVNYANSSFTFNQLFSKSGSGQYNPDLNGLNDRMHFRNFIGLELHTQLFALGYKYQEYSIVFSVTEKLNLPITYPKDLINLAIEGNAPFIGDNASLRGTGLYLNHYREYAIGISKNPWGDMFVGIRAKLLFGKLNISPRKADINLHTDENTFDLNFDGGAIINTSLPINAQVTNNMLNSLTYNESVSPVALILNRKNPGIAFDAGMVYPYTDKIQLSASVLDLGLIHWGSNLNTFDATGSFVFTGILNSDSSYVQNLSDQFMQQMSFNVYQKKYFTFLPPRFIAGANYTYNKYFSAGINGSVLIYKTKTLPTLTLSGQAKPFNWLGFIASYSIQNYSLNNLGFGFFIGKNPVQLYMVSDNVMAILKPLDTRMVNLRFGLNINLGCKKKADNDSSKKSAGNSCFGMPNTTSKKYMRKAKPWANYNK